MKYIDEFREKRRIKGILESIRRISTKRITIMEICGTHTHTISRYGIREAVLPNINLISGPGCPVCVTPPGDIERIIEFSRRRRDVIIATFGDMMKVPGRSSTLQDEKARGGDIRVVYSPISAIEIASSNPQREVILYAVGFETTAPTVAATILMAERKGLKNLSILSLHKLTPPAMRALMESGEIDIDGFICPGHVTAIIGAGAYEFLSREYSSPSVVAGFEPLDTLQGIYMLVRQIEEGKSNTEIQYSRVVTWEGNERAKAVMDEVFEVCDTDWRGMGTIPSSGLRIRDEFAGFDAEKRFSIERIDCGEPPGCECGRVLKGLISPPDCRLFGSVCTPASPVGPCMVSSEGTCAAYFRYRSVVQ